ncbi:MAG: circadian clock KaiB family protein [Aeromicrobium sp.]
MIDGAPWHLRLYVAGESPVSLAAFANLQVLCAIHLDEPYWIELVDLLARPDLAREDGIIAVPTLVRRRPEPVCTMIGDLSNTARVLEGLRLPAEVIAS